MRFWLLGLLMLTVAACQAPADRGAVPAGSAAAKDAALDTKDAPSFFAPELSDLRFQIAAGLQEACFPHNQLWTEYEGCLRRHIVDAFDDSGLGGQRCADKAKINDFGNCVVNGNAALDVMHRLGATPPTEQSYWSDNKAMNRMLQKATVLGALGHCPGLGTVPAMRACADRWLVSRLGIPSDLAGRCPTSPDDPRRGECLYQAISIRYMQDHVARLTAIST